MNRDVTTALIHVLNSELYYIGQAADVLSEVTSNETSSIISLRSDKSLIVVWCARDDAAGGMSREIAADYIDTWSGNDEFLCAASLWWDQGGTASLG